MNTDDQILVNMLRQMLKTHEHVVVHINGMGAIWMEPLK